MITTQRELRKQFWIAHPDLSREPIVLVDGTPLMYRIDTRCAFNEWVDQLEKNGEITEALAARVTLT